MKQNRKFSIAFLIGMGMLLFLSLSAFAAGTETKAPDMSISRNMKTAAENTAAGSGTISQQVGIWGSFGGTSMAYTPGKAEDGVSSALYITGGTNDGGGTLALNDSGFSTNIVTFRDAAGNIIGTTKGFIEASELVIRVKSTSSFSVQFLADYRVAPTKTLTSKSVTIPSTNGEWKDITIPWSYFEPDTNGKWIYNMQGIYSSNFNPVIELKITGANFGDTKYAAIGELRVNWYKENMIYDAKIQGQKTSYMQNYDSFDYKTGKIVTKKGDSSVNVNGTKVLSGQASSNLGLADGNITIQSKAKDGTTKNYNIAVNSTASNNADMVGLSLNIGNLDQVVDPNVTEYTAKIPNSASRVRFTPKTYDINSTYTVNGSSGTSYVEITMNTGTMTIPIVITAQDGTKKTYTVTTTRGANNDDNADLYNLTLSKGYLDQSFDPKLTTYTATVSNTTASITVTPTKEDTNATIKVNGLSVSSGAASSSIALNVGENIITVEVTAKNTAIVKTYTFTITREDVKTDNADLFLATISAGTLNKDFNRTITEYAATVEGNVSTIKITPTKADANSTIKVNGAAVTSGFQSGNINLAVGDTIIPVVVTAQNGTTTKTYNFTITRKPNSNDSTLFNLKLSNGKLSPVFDSNTFAYSVNVANAVSNIQVTPYKSNSYASIKVNSTAVTSGSASAAINLSVGNTTINVEVTAQDGTKKTYVLTVTRAAVDNANANLFNIALSKGIIKSDFNPATTTYQAQVSNDTDIITVTPTASDGNATIKVNGVTVTSGSASGNISLASGDNTITIAVTAKDSTVKIYTITVTRIIQTDTNADLLSLDVTGAILSPAFSPDITQYTLLTPQSIGNVTVTPTMQNSNVTIEELALDDPRVKISGFNNTTLNNNLTITVNALSSTFTYPVSIVPFTLPSTVNITVDSPRLAYQINDPFDFATGKIIVHYTDKPEEQIALNDKNVVVTGFDSSAEAHGQVITVIYGGKTITYTIDVLPYIIPGLTAINLSDIKKLYKVGDTFDWYTGAIVPVISGKNGTPVKLYNRYVTITGFDSTSAVSGQLITVSYAGFSTTYQIDFISQDLPVAYTLEQTMQSGSQPPSWGGWGGMTLTYEAGKAENGVGTALYATGATIGGGGAIIFTGGNFGAGSVTQPDGTTLNGFIGADAIKFRYNSTKAATISFQTEYRASGSPTKTSRGVTLPSTGGVWQDIIIPLSSFENPSGTTTEDQKASVDWIHNMKGGYTTDYEPVAELRFSCSLGVEHVTIGNMKFLWYEDKAFDSISVLNLQTQYHQFEQFNLSKGQVVLHYKDGTTKTTSLSDPAVIITGFNSNSTVNDQSITVNYKGMITSYNINIILAVKEVTFVADGNVLCVKTLNEGDTLTDIPPVPEKPGYTGAWDRIDFTNIKSDLIVNAIYTPINYTIKFIADGVTIDTKSVNYGSTLTAVPTVPEKIGYTGSWDRADFTNITSNLTVNAVYTPITTQNFGMAVDTVAVEQGSSKVITVPVRISKMPTELQISSISTNFTFDATKLIFQPATDPTSLAGSMILSPSTDIIIGSDPTSDGSQGTLTYNFATTTPANFINKAKVDQDNIYVNLKFKLADGLAVGTYPINIVPTSELCDGNLNEVISKEGMPSYLTVGYIKVLPNDCEVVNSIIPENATISADAINASVTNNTKNITVDITPSAYATWKLYSNASCTSEIINKVMPLNVGTNTAYIKVTSLDRTKTRIYTLTVLRNGIVVNNVASQQGGKAKIDVSIENAINLTYCEFTFIYNDNALAIDTTDMNNDGVYDAIDLGDFKVLSHTPVSVDSQDPLKRRITVAVQYDSDGGYPSTNTPAKLCSINFDIKKMASVGTSPVEILANTEEQTQCYGVDKDGNVVAFNDPKMGNVTIQPQAVTSISILGADNISENKQTATYQAEILPDYVINKEVTWSVSDTTIANINDSGVLTPLTNGTVDVIATAKDGSNVTGRITVTIIGQKADNLTGLTISDITLDPLFTNSVYRYTAKVMSNISSIQITPVVPVGCSYELSKNGIIVNGNIVNLDEGLNNITIAVKKPNLYDTVYTFEITRGYTVKSINIIGNTAITSNKERALYTTECLPEDADIKDVDWSVSNTSIASISASGKLTPLTNGIVDVIATAKDGSNITGRTTVTITGQKASLTQLTAGSGIMSVPFEPYKYSYNLYVPQTQTSISLKPTFTGGTLKNNSLIWANNISKNFSLTNTNTEIKLDLTQSNLDAVTYTVNVIKIADGLISDSISVYNGSQRLESLPEQGGQYSIKSTYVNNSSISYSTYYSIAIISQNTLIKVIIVPKTFAPGEAYTFDSLLDIPSLIDAPGLEIKAMLWEDLSSLKPYAADLSISRK